MATYQVTVLGADNGSGIFELGGSLNTDKVQALTPLSLADAVSRALLEQVDNASDVKVYDLNITKLGEHHIVTFCTSEEGCGEQAYAFACTEVA